MGNVLIVLHVVVCLFLILVVLLQSGKGGGMGAIGGGSSSTGSVFGGRGASTFLSKLTSVMAAAFMVLSVALTLVNYKEDFADAAEKRNTEVKEEAQEKSDAEKADGEKAADV